MKSLSTLFESRFSLSLIVMLFSANTAFCQAVFEDWVQGTGSQNYFLKSTVKTDANRNVYQAGATISSAGDYDVIVTKYNPRGEEIWTRTYDVAGYDDAAIDLFIDNNSNVYLAGATFNPSNSGYKVLVLKYSSSGTFLWDDVHSYPNSLYSLATTITGNGNSIYIGGATYNITNQADYLALSYTSNGNIIWNYSWNNLSYNDVITKIHLDGNTISLAGGTQIDTDKWKYAIVNLEASTGNFQVQKISGGSGNGIDKITGLVRDNAGNIYVTGGAVNSNTGYDFRTLKLDSDLNVAWSASYNSNGDYNDVANALAVDPAGNVYVAGYSESAVQGTNYTTVKYNASGSQLWVATYDGKANVADTAKAIMLDQYNQPIITGVSENTANEDFYTVKYNSNGNEIWHIRYNGVSNGNDNPFDIAIDNNGDILVAGQSEIGGSYRYTSVKYIERHIVNPPDEENNPSSGYFTENNGQLVNTNNQPANEVKFIAGADYPKVYVQDHKLSYVFHKVDSLATDTVHRIDMVFNERTKNPKIRGLDKIDFYQNYYLPTVTDGKRERVESYKKLISLDVWDDIDLMISHNNKGLKYYFICKPGFNPADIGWKYEGAASVTVNASGDLVLASSIGSVIMPKGEAYEVNSSGTRIDKIWQPTYSVSGSSVSLGIGSYNTNNTLIIEIDNGLVESTGGVTTIGNMLWNSHYGNEFTTHFKDVDTDNLGNIFITGETNNADFPVLTGQEVLNNYENGFDVFVFQLTEDVVPVWMTFFGGSENNTGGNGNDIVLAVDVYNSSSLTQPPHGIFIAGYSDAVDMPIEDNSGVYDSDSHNDCSTSNCFDAFIAEFSANGALIWSTYYGEDGDEKLFDIEMDQSGQLYAVGQKNNNTSLLVRPGAANYTIGNGLLLRYWNRNLTWATAWDSEVIQSITTDKNKYIYTTGTTLSPNMPTLNIDPNFPESANLNTSGESDVYVNCFNPTGGLETSFYWGGDCPEAGSTIDVDEDFNVYVGLSTHFSYAPPYCQDLPVINGTPSIAAQDDYILKFKLQPSGTLIQHSSYFGGGWGDGFITIFPSGALQYEHLRMKMATSKNGMLYVGGYTRSIHIEEPNNQPFGFYDKGINTSYLNQGIAIGDNFVAAYDQNMNLVWSTFHGSDKYDIFGGIAVSESNQRLVMVGTGNQGLTYMDVESFDPVEYNEQLDSDYFQAGPTINPSPIRCGQGAIFDISQIDFPTGLKNSDDKSFLTIWPNPTNSSIIINSIANSNHITIFDISGRIMKRYDNQSNQTEIDISKYPSGVYVIKIENVHGVFSKKVVKL